MSCLFTHSITNCDYNNAGLKEVYLTNKSSISAYTYNSSDVITSVTLHSGHYFYQFDSTEAFIDFTGNLSDSNNGFFNSQTINLQFHTLEWEKRLKLEKLLTSSIVIFALDNNDNLFCLGEKNGLIVDSINEKSGRRGSDYNGYEIVLRGSEETLTKEANSSVYYAIIANVNGLDCSQYSATTWGSEVVDFNLIGECYFSEFA